MALNKAESRANFNPISHKGGETAISTPKSNDTKLKKLTFPNSLESFRQPKKLIF